MPTSCFKKQFRYGSRFNHLKRMQASVLLCVLLLLSGGLSEEYYEYYGEEGTFPSCPYSCTCTEVENDCSNANLGTLPQTISSSIQRLIVSGNSLSSIDSITSQGFHSLMYIDASSNIISSIDWSSFALMTSLEELHLQMNNLFIVDLSYFSVSKLLVLNVSGNKLVSIVTGETELPLEHLYIQDCDLSYFNFGASISFPELKTLHAGGNAFGVLPDGAFSHMTNLKELKLDNCGLSSLSVDIFSSNVALEILDLSNNFIINLPDGIFPSSLSHINLSGNRWQCDCSLIWLKIFVESLMVSGGVFENESSTFCSSSEEEEISSTITGTSAYSFSGCSGSEQLHRSARSATAISSLQNWSSMCTKLQGNQNILCGPDRAASCLYDFANESHTLVQYNYQVPRANIKSDCRNECAAHGDIYFFFDDSSSMCLCGNQTNVSGCSDCSSSSKDGPSLCNSEFSNVMGASNVLYDSRISISPTVPETNTNVTFSITGGFSSYNLFSWNFGDGSITTIASNIRTVSHIFLYPGEFRMALYFSSSNNSIPTFQVNLNVTVAAPQDPGEISCPGAPVSTYQSLDIKATFSAAWQQGVKWTKTPDTSVTSTSLDYDESFPSESLSESEENGECDAGWIPFKNRCVQALQSYVPFTTAISTCSGLGASLLRVHSQQEVESLISNSQLFPSGSNPTYYTSAQWQSTLKTYRWMPSFDQAFIFQESLTSAPDESCIALDEAGLRGISCSTTLLALCEKDPTVCQSNQESDRKTCYIHVGQSVTWEEADLWCRSNYSNGMLATISGANDNSAVQSLISSSSWLGLQAAHLEGHYHWSDGHILSGYSNWVNQGSESCVIMQSNSQWETTSCDDQHEFVCEYFVGDKVTVQHLVSGLPSLSLGDQIPLTLASSPSGPTSSTSTLTLLPGTWFSTPGSMKKWYSVLNPMKADSSVVFQVWRPVCSSGTLLPPGCQNDSPWYTCSDTSQSITCNAVECDSGSSFCHLTQTCLQLSQPCTCSSYAVASTINCSKNSLDSNVPNYMLTHMATITVPAGASIVSTEVDGVVSEGDIVGFQSEHPDQVNCEDSVASQWSYPRVTIAQSKWMVVGDVISIENEVLDKATQCQLSAVYVKQSVMSYPSSINYLTSSGNYIFSVGPISETGASINCSLSAIDSIEGLSWVYPPATSSILGNNGTLSVTADVVAGTPYSLVVKLLRGSDVNMTWTVGANDPVQTSMISSCPASISSQSEKCQYQTSFLSEPYSSLTHTFDYNSIPANIMVNASNEISSQIVSIILTTYEEISNVTLNHRNCVNDNSNSSCEINVEVNSDETFFISTQSSGIHLITVSEDGSSFTSGTSNLTQFSRVFSTSGTYTISVNASNVVSFKVSTITVNAYIKADFANLNFTNHIDKVAMGDPVDIIASASVTLGSYYVVVWSIGVHDPFTFTKKSADDIIINPSIMSFMFPESGVQTISLRLEDAFGNNETISMSINVYKRITDVVFSLDSLFVATGTEFTIGLRVDNSTQPDSDYYGSMNFTLDFGDGTPVLTWLDANPIQEVTHTYTTVGIFTISVSVFSHYESTLTVSRDISLETQESICSVSLNYDGPKHVSQEVEFNASIGCGSSVEYHLECGDGHTFDFQTGQIFRYTYSQAAVYEAKLVARNSVSRKSTKLTLYAFDENLLEIIKISSRNCIALNGTFNIKAEVAAEHPDNIYYHWDFGNNDIIEGVGQTSVQSVFKMIGEYEVMLTVTHPSNNKTQLQSKEICVEIEISGIEVLYSSPIALYPPDGEKNATFIATVDAGSNLTFSWTSDTITGVESYDSYLLTIDTASNYSVSVRVSNDIGHESKAVVLVVQEIITGLTITCTSCFDTKYAAIGTNTSFLAGFEYGTDQAYEWQFGNVNLLVYTDAIDYAFLSIGVYNVSLFASNMVSQNRSFFTIIAQEAISDVLLQTNQTSVEVYKDLNFAVSFQKGSDVSISWNCSSNSSYPNNATDVTLSFSTKGFHECRVTVSNDVSSKTVSQNITVLEMISNLTIAHNLTIENSLNLYAAAGENYLFSANSNAEFLVTFSWELKQNTTLLHSDTGPLSNYIFPSDGEYTLSLTAANDISMKQVLISITCHERITNVACVTNSSSGNKSLVGDILEFYVTMDSGTAVQYRWEQDSQLLSFNTNTIQINMTEAGTTRMTCSASNVFGSHTVFFYVNVYDPVAGVSIQVDKNDTLPFIALNEPIRFSAPNAKGTEISYEWTVLNLSSLQADSYTDEEITHGFAYTGSYSIHLEVSNALSSQEETILLYVQAPITDLEIVMGSRIAATGSSISFQANANPGATNVTFTWTINGKMSHNQNYVENFNNPGFYVVVLFAANNVSSITQTETLTIMDPVSGLKLHNCSAVIPGLITTVFEASVDAGSNLTYSWAVETDGNNITGSTEVLKHIFQEESFSYIYLQAENAISSESTKCGFEVQLPVNNVTISITYPDPNYIFLDKDVVFAVSGNNLMFATFEWNVTALGSIFVTPGSSLNTSFSAIGNYTLSVVVKNELNEQMTTLDFWVKLFQCDLPGLSQVGSLSRSVMRSHVLELEVAVDPKGCTEYLAVHKWVVFKASDCNGDLSSAEKVDIGDTHTSSPALIIQPRVLETGDYCIRFRTGYQYTSVFLTMRYAVTVEGSDLTAVIRGGTGRTVSLGENFCMDGNLSYDPDISTGSPNLTYSWECVEMTANGGCFQPSSSSFYCYQGFQEGKYKIKLHISAPGRTGDTAEQIIDVLDFQDFVPIASIVCESCSTLGNYRISASQHVALSAGCENCQCTPSFIWQIYQGQSLVPLTLRANDTTTGVNDQNLVLKKWGALTDGMDYTFVVLVSCSSVSANTGTASLILHSNSPPTGGQCVISPTEITPLEEQVTVNCPNWFDIDDPNTLITYQIEVDSTYILYTGTDSSQSVYLGSLNKETVSMRVLISDEFGAAVIGGESSITLRNATLDNSTKLEYLINQTDFVLSALIKQAAPTSLLQYAIALCQQLNKESEYEHTTEIPGSGSNAEQSRTTIRDALTISLASAVPMSTINDVKQMSYAMSLLTEFSTEFLTEGCQILMIQTIEKMTAILLKLSSNGLDRNDIPTMNMLTILNNLVCAANARVYATHGVWQSGRSISLNNLTTDFRTLRPEISSMVNGLDLTGVILDETHRQTVTSVAMPLLESVLVATLQSMMVNEDGIQMEMEGLKVKALRTYAKHMLQEDFSTSSQISFPPSIISPVKNDSDEIFQILLSHTANPYSYGYLSYIPSSMPVETLSFHEPNGSLISIQNLEPESRPTFYRLNNGQNLTSAITVGRLNESDIYDPLESLQYKMTNISAKQAKAWMIPDTSTYLTDGGGLHIQIRLIFQTNEINKVTSSSTVRIYLSINDPPSSDSYQQTKILTPDLMEVGMDHREYTLFIADLTSSDLVYIRAENNDDRLTVELSVAVYISYCLYFDTTNNGWSTYGCTPTEESIAIITACQCNHLTSFGGAGFVSLASINFQDLTNLDLTTNPVVFIAITVIFVTYILMVVLCRYLDVINLRRISHIPLCGRDGPFKYEITVMTGKMFGAGTTAHIGMKLYGESDKGEARHLTKSSAFQRNCSDTFLVAYDVNLGDVTKILVWHDNTGLSPSWFLSHVEVRDVQTGAKYSFLVNSWLSLEMKDGVVQKTVKFADDEDVRRFKLSFTSVFYQKLSDFHLWLSVSHRPDHSRFTRCQRASCCLTAIYLYMCVNAIWYGLIKDANDVNGNVQDNVFGWEEIIIAMVSAAIVLPIVLGLMFLFKKTRCKDSLFQEVQRPSSAQTIEIDAVCDMSRDGMSMRTMSPLGDWIPAIDRESTSDSFNAPCDLKRTVPMHRVNQRLNSGDSMKVKPAIPGGGKKELWNEDNIMQNWPHKMPTWIKEVKADIRVKNKSGSVSQKGLEDEDDLDQQLDEFYDQIERDEERRRRRQLSAEKRRKRMGSDDLFDSDDEWVHEDLGDMNTTKGDDSVSTFNPRGEAELIPMGDRSKSLDTCLDPLEASGSSKQASRTVWQEHSFMSAKSRNFTLPRENGRIQSPSTLSQSATQTNQTGFSFPWSFIYINYAICASLCVISCILILLYGYQFGSTVATKWLLSLLITLLISFLILEPLKVLALSIIVTWGTQDIRDDERDLIDVKPNVDGNEQIKDVKFKPLGGFALLQAKEDGKKRERLHTLMRELVVFTLMFIIFLSTVYVNYWNSSIYHTNANIFNKINNSTSSLNISNLKSINDYWSWAQDSMSTAIHLENLNSDESFGHLMGPAWLRQIRSERVSCPAATEKALPYIKGLDSGRCVNEANESPDTNPYMVGWVNSSTSLYNYTFSSAAHLDMFSKFGQWLLYQGGGYIQRLGTTYNDTLEALSTLESDGWIDQRTRAVFMEMTLYSPSDDFASCVTILTEFPISGGVLTQVTVSTEKLLRHIPGVVDPLMVCQVLFTPFIIYFLVMLVMSVKREGLKYLTSFWNWVDLWICVFSLTCFGLYVTCVSTATAEVNSFLENRAESANLFSPVLYHTLLRYIQAIILFLFHLKIVKQIRFARPLYKFYVTLTVAKGPLSGVALIFIILILSYANMTHLLYLSLVGGYRTYGNSITSLFGVICGLTSFDPLFEAERVLTHFVFLSFGLFVYGLIVALIVAVLSHSFKWSRSQMSFKTSLEARDYEMIDFFMKRFKLMTGIEKQKPSFRHVKFEGLPSLPSRGTSSNLSSRQSCLSPTSGPASEYGHLDLDNQSLDYLMASLLPTWDQVAQSFSKIEELEKQEEDMTKRLHDAAKSLSQPQASKSSQGTQLKVFATPAVVGKPPLDPKASFAHLLPKNGSRRPTVIKGRASMTPPSTFASDTSFGGRKERPFSDQGVRSDPNRTFNVSQFLRLDGSAHKRGSPGPGFYRKGSSSSSTSSIASSSTIIGHQPLDVTVLDDKPFPKHKEAWQSNT